MGNQFGATPSDLYHVNLCMLSYILFHSDLIFLGIEVTKLSTHATVTVKFLTNAP